MISPYDWHWYIHCVRSVHAYSIHIIHYKLSQIDENKFTKHTIHVQCIRWNFPSLSRWHRCVQIRKNVLWCNWIYDMQTMNAHVDWISFFQVVGVTRSPFIAGKAPIRFFHLSSSHAPKQNLSFFRFLHLSHICRSTDCQSFSYFVVCTTRRTRIRCCRCHK